MTFATLISIIPVLAVLAGLAGAKFRRVPIAAAGLLVAAYGLYMTAVGIWAARCWDCRGLSETRGEVFTVSGIYFGLIAAITLLSIWLGARLATMLQRLLRTWRELRDGARERRASEAGKGST